MVTDHINQAKHNEKVCNHLSSKETYSDWVITTAFYSAIHYVRCLMIPCNIDGTEYNCFDSLFSKFKQSSEGRHGFQARYVLVNYPEIDSDYRILLDMSNNARYINYQYSREQAKVAKESLRTIKEYVLNKS